MKIISYALFGDTNSFEFPFYLRGIYYNIRMNRMLYPDWYTMVTVQKEVNHKYTFLLHELKSIIDYGIAIRDEAPRCEAMLWRLDPLFKDGVSVVLSRDADAVTTYREACAVNEWLYSSKGYHGINDDPAHSIEMMGGMCGFKVDAFKQDFPDLRQLSYLTLGANLDNHGTDQNLLMSKIYPRIKDKLLLHKNPPQRRDNKLWESDLTCRMIGSPGVVDFELLRFFQRFDKNPRLDRFEHDFSDTFYWAK